MKTEVKNKLIAALESGSYRQTYNELRRGDCYCVLGVLCDLYDKEHPNEKGWQSLITTAGIYGFFDSKIQKLRTICPPTQVLEWAELGSTPAWFKKVVKLENGDEYAGLADCNDQGLTFKEIAEIIKKTDFI